jgi:hypothetical protein
MSKPKCQMNVKIPNPKEKSSSRKHPSTLLRAGERPKTRKTPVISLLTSRRIDIPSLVRSFRLRNNLFLL